MLPLCYIVTNWENIKKVTSNSSIPNTFKVRLGSYTMVTKLQNGLPIITKKTNSDATTLLFAINVGSNDDAVNGVSHFLEHMIFEGTKQFPTALELNHVIDNIGGELNAMTGKNRTIIYLKVRKRSFVQALKVLSDMVIYPRFSTEAFKKEKDVILHEIEHAQDEPRLKQWLEFDAAMFTKHPAKSPVSGTTQSVKNMTLENIKAHFQKYYVAHNACFVITGNIPAQYKKLCEFYLGEMPSGEKNIRKLPIEVKGKKLVKLSAGLSQSYYICGYHITDDVKTAASFDIIEAILSKGQTGWLFDEFRIKRGIAYDVRAHHEGDKTCSYFAVSIVTSSQHLPYARKKIQALLEQLKFVDEQTVQHAKNYVLGKFALLKDESTYYAHYLSDSYFDHIGDYKKMIQAVTVADVKKCASTLTEKTELILN